MTRARPSRTSSSSSSVQNSRAVRSGRAGASARPRSKTRRAKHGGGRPLAFIPALVVAEARRLFDATASWVEVLHRLRESGNGTYARNTLIRRVRRSAVQNGAEASTSTPASSGPAGRSKTRRSGGGAGGAWNRWPGLDLDDERACP